MIRKPKILLIGDLIVDVHHFGEDGGISTETGGPVGIHKETKTTWGGAGLVARNILALGGAVTFISTIGDDEAGAAVNRFSHKNLRKVFFEEKSRQTITKERFLIGGKKVFRWNRGDSTPISGTTQKAILVFLKKNLKTFDKIIISDYRHGLLTKNLAAKVLKICREQKKAVYADSQVVRTNGNHDWYRGADLICLNQKEAATVDVDFGKDNLAKSLSKISAGLKAENVIIKLGAQGSVALIKGRFLETPAHKVKSIDPVGAGDAFLAALAVQSNLSPETLAFANKWAALATTINGTEPPERKNLESRL